MASVYIAELEPDEFSPILFDLDIASISEANEGRREMDRLALLSSLLDRLTLTVDYVSDIEYGHNQRSAVLRSLASPGVSHRTDVVV